MAAPLLGRFDRFLLEEGKHTYLFKLNQTLAGDKKARESSYVPYFRRQQTGLPFACALADATKIKRLERYADGHNPFPQMLCHEDPDASKQSNRTPIAILSVLLTQRSARLTFVERLLAENVVFGRFKRIAENAPGSSALPTGVFESPYRYFQPERDIGLLTDGWGDIFLILFCDIPAIRWNPKEETRNWCQYAVALKDIEGRLDNVIKLRKYLFRDPLVIRSETSYTPVAVDTALLYPHKYAVNMSLRFKSALDGKSLTEKMENHMRAKLENPLLKDMFDYSRVSGRLDYSISTRVHDASLAEANYMSLFKQKSFMLHQSEERRYGVLYEMLRDEFFHDGTADKSFGCHIDSTRTSISEMIFNYDETDQPQTSL